MGNHKHLLLLLAFSVWVSIPPLAHAQTAAPTTTAAEQVKTLSLSVEQAVMMALERNQSLKVERLRPALNQVAEDEAAAAFDIGLSAEVAATGDRALRTLGNSAQFLDIISSGSSSRFGVNKLFPSGTSISFELSATPSQRYWSNYTQQQVTRMGVSFTQALLQGARPQVNLAQLEQAAKTTEISRYELNAWTQTLVADTEKAFWDLSLAQKQMLIVESSLTLAEAQLTETQERIAVGKLAEIELRAVEAEIALRRQDVIVTTANRDKARLRLLRLLNPEGNWAQVTLNLREVANIPDVQLDSVDTHVSLALKLRPELHQTRLQIARNDLELVRTRDGLLPRLDLFANLGKTGYADSFLGAVENNLLGQNYDFNAGVNFSYPLGNRIGEARLKRAELTQAQTQEALANLEQLILMDIHNAYIEVRQAREQILAAQASRTAQQAKLEVETERYRVGRSTSYIVAQAQRDLLNSQTAELTAMMTYMKTITDFYRLEGSLLERRQITLK